MLAHIIYFKCILNEDLNLKQEHLGSDYEHGVKFMTCIAVQHLSFFLIYIYNHNELDTIVCVMEI